MARTVGIVHQDFGQFIQANCFYIDKTLNMSMLEYFFSRRYADMGHLFKGLAIFLTEGKAASENTEKTAE